MLIPTMLASLFQNGVLLLCGWKTFKVLETPRSEDDTHWLTFWFVYTVFAFAKSIVDFVAFVIPFYHEAFLGFTVYLGFFGGATHLYTTALKPLLKQHEALIDETLSKASSTIQSKASEAMSSAQTMAQEALKNKMAQDALKKTD